MRDSLLVFGGVVVSSIFNYLYYMLVARSAGVEIYGEVTALASATLVLLTPGIIGQIIAARIAADLKARHDEGALRSLADRVTRWATLCGIGICITGLAFLSPLSSYFHLRDPWPIVMALSALAIYGVVAVQRGVLQGAHEFQRFSVSSSVDAILKVLVGVPLVRAFGASGALFGITLGAATALAYNFVAISRTFGADRAPISLDRKLIERIISGVGLGQLTFSVLTFYDVPLVEHAFDPRSAGLYAAAALTGRAVFTAVSFIPTLLMPKTSARIARGESAFPLLARSIAFALLVVLPVAVAGLVFPRQIVVIFAGGAFTQAAPLVFPYLAASSMLALANVVASFKMGLHQYNFVLPSVTVAALQIAIVALWHPSTQMVVLVLLGANTLLFIGTLYRLRPPQQPSDESLQLPKLAVNDVLSH